MLLAEIGEIPLDMQPNLLRLLEQRPLHPVAGTTRLPSRLLLAHHFARAFAARRGKAVRGISFEAQRRLLCFDWPGNVRQLEGGEFG